MDGDKRLNTENTEKRREARKSLTDVGMVRETINF
jgi:hypothetical protein